MKEWKWICASMYDFIKLFKDYKIDYTTKSNRGWINVECVYCTSSSHSKHLGFNLADGHCTCWKCGGHQATPTLARLLAIPSGEVNQVLAQYESRNYVLNHLNKRIPQAKHLELPTDTFTPAERKYLLSRNFSPRYLHEKYGVVGGGISGDWKYRIIIPLIINGKIVSWTGRTILSKKKADELKIPRYKNLSIEESCVNPKTSLFNLDNSLRKEVIITEGCFDVMRFGGLNFNKNDNIICSFGTTMTEEQLKVIADRYEKVFMMFDNEPEAQEKARKYGLQLSSMGLSVEVVDFYSDFGVNDLGDCSDEQVNIIKKELGFL